MYIRPFEYLRATSIQEASDMLRGHGDGAKVLAGGQSLMPMINLGLIEPEVLIDIMRIPGLATIQRHNGTLVLGALTRYRTIEEDPTVANLQPLLHEVVHHVGNRRVRNAGTIGGSIAHSDPAAEVPLTMALLEAEYEMSDGHSVRRAQATGFPVTFFTTQLQPAELIVSVRVPVLAAEWGWGFHEFVQRAGDFALVSAMALARCRDDLVEELRLGLGGVGERPVRCRTQEDAALGRPISEVLALVASVGQELVPTGDAFASAEYRAHLAGALAARAVADACRRSQGTSS